MKIVDAATRKFDFSISILYDELAQMLTVRDRITLACTTEETMTEYGVDSKNFKREIKRTLDDAFFAMMGVKREVLFEGFKKGDVLIADSGFSAYFPNVGYTPSQCVKICARNYEIGRKFQKRLVTHDGKTPHEYASTMISPTNHRIMFFCGLHNISLHWVPSTATWDPCEPALFVFHPHLTLCPSVPNTSVIISEYDVNAVTSPALRKHALKYGWMKKIEF